MDQGRLRSGSASCRARESNRPGPRCACGGSRRVSLYVNSSALLKRYVDEPDSDVADSLRGSDPPLLTARHTIVEVRRNLARLLAGRGLATARSAFSTDLEVLSIVELDEVTCELAAQSAEVTGGGALVALHSAAAQGMGGPAVPFLTFDVR